MFFTKIGNNEVEKNTGNCFFISNGKFDTLDFSFLSFLKHKKIRQT